MIFLVFMIHGVCPYGDIGAFFTVISFKDYSVLKKVVGQTSLILGARSWGERRLFFGLALN